MAVRVPTAPAPTPRSKTLAQPQVAASASVHTFSSLSGDVRVGANVWIAPGSSVRADEGAPFHIGDRSRVQEGVMIHGLEQGHVLGDDQQPYSVWIGDNTAITHMALIHGPAYVGNSCFIGFRSTIFNARVNDGCVVMMHCLIQDVEIPPGRYVPSGSVITAQAQADRLPDVRAVDQQFVAQVVGLSHSSRSSSHVESRSPVSSDRTPSNTPGLDMTTYSPSNSLDASVVSHVRQLLNQGYRIGTEHADKRQFQTTSWKSGAPIQATSEASVLRDLQACLAEHAGKYVRLIGIDTKAKRRVFETIIQRPDGQTVTQPANSRVPFNGAVSNASSNGHASSGMNGDVVSQIRQLLAQGARIGTEHADPRRYKINSWASCSPIQATNESGVLAALDACVAEHAGEYVRVIGIDPKAKRRLAEIVISRPDGNGASAGKSASFANGAAPSAGSTEAGLAQQLGQLLAQGCALTLEYADERRYKINSWNSGGAVPAGNTAGAIAAIDKFIASNSSSYIRVVAIDPKVKRRAAEVMVYRPSKGGTAAPKASAPSSYAAPSYAAPASSNGKGHLNGEVASQVRQLLNQSYKIGVEYADARRYKIGGWQTGTPIPASNESGVMSAIESFIAQHSGEYVRLVGIDPKVKRRVVETVIHKPSK